MIKTSKLLISTLAIGLVLVFTQSCTKYEEGPSFTLRTAESRLIGSWRIVMFGEVPQIATSTYEFKKDGSFSVEGTQKLGIGSEGTWEWESDDYQALVLTSTSDGSTLTLDIKRLSNKEMITQSLTHPSLSLVVKTEFEKQQLIHYMNHRSRTFRLLFLLIIVSTVGCTTYEDGPKLSLQTADTRLIGKWVLTAVGDEALLGTAEYEFRDDWSFKASEDPITGLEGEVNGSWSWQGEEQKTILIRPENTGTVLYFEVRRLTSNELKVKATSRGTDESLDTTMEYRKI